METLESAHRKIILTEGEPNTRSPEIRLTSPPGTGQLVPFFPLQHIYCDHCCLYSPCKYCPAEVKHRGSTATPTVLYGNVRYSFSVSGLRSVEDFCLNPSDLQTKWVSHIPPAPPPPPPPHPFQTPQVEGVRIQNHELLKPFYRKQAWKPSHQRYMTQTCRLASARGRRGGC